MALIQVNYMSRALFRTVPLNVILPADKYDSDTDKYLISADYKYRTLYLLHGLLGNYTDWISKTRSNGRRAGHDWDFWDSQIKKVLDWLPL